MTKKDEQGPEGHDERLAHGYNRMLERVRGLLARPGEPSRLQHAIEIAKERAQEVGELTREEAERIAAYMHRDLLDAGNYLSSTGKAIDDWLSFEWAYAEDWIKEMFSKVVDQSRVELEQFTRTPRKLGERYSGEVTAPGVFVCDRCGHELTLTRTGHIPPCAHCHGTVFWRRYGAETPDES
ncbi:zinc ribbon-containing protein [Ectothiorhodospiraceae bacterium 2226]|nr:zinc ribbon-containing protein [Ectothiorhodospiraceae bacterium 2226]